MSKKYRGVAVQAAVQNWNLSQWFTADQLLPRAVDSLPQRSCSINVYSVSRYLRLMASRGSLDSRLNTSGVKEFTKVNGDDEDAHFYA